MKKTITLIILSLIACTAASCSTGNSSASSASTAAETTAATAVETSTTAAAATEDSASLNSKIDGVLAKTEFKGIVCATKNGEIIYQSVSGTDEKGNDLTEDSTMYIGSLSKSFCAASVLILRDSGKLGLDDTLDKYFPTYSHGKEISVRNLLDMRSGIPEVRSANLNTVTEEQTEEQNVANTKEWIFSQDLEFTPDSAFEYCNTNYNLLAYIVEDVSGMHYNEFVRANIFEPLGMTHSGFVSEVKDDPSWASGLTYESFMGMEAAAGVVKGAGDIASNAKDMEAYMTALQSNKLFTEESRVEMTTNYSPDSNPGYCLGLWPDPCNGVGHNGGIGDYYGRIYMNKELGINLFVSSREYGGNPEDMSMELINIIAKQ